MKNALLVVEPIRRQIVIVVRFSRGGFLIKDTQKRLVHLVVFPLSRFLDFCFELLLFAPIFTKQPEKQDKSTEHQS